VADSGDPLTCDVRCTGGPRLATSALIAGVRVCSRSGGCNSQGVPAENHEGRADHDLPDRF
jgi:hypothetical protein